MLTSGDTKVKKPSSGLHVVLETDREKAIVSEICSGSTEKRVSRSSGKVLSGILKNKICLFLQRGEVFQGKGMACAKPWNCDDDVTSPGNHEYIPIGGI